MKVGSYIKDQNEILILIYLLDYYLVSNEDQFFLSELKRKLSFLFVLVFEEVWCHDSYNQSPLLVVD